MQLAFKFLRNLYSEIFRGMVQNTAWKLDLRIDLEIFTSVKGH